MTDRGLIWAWFPIILTLVLLASSCQPEQPDTGPSIESTAKNTFNQDFLIGDEQLSAPMTTQAYSPPKNSSLAKDKFAGVLSLKTDSSANGIKVVKDSFGISAASQWNLSTLPAFSFEYVSDGVEIIPALRQPQRGSHPYWEIILEPGRVWSEPQDMGWSRAALPFALKEKNQNCTHNGLMTFLYKGDGSISRVAWQVGSETCLYLKVDLWGMAEARYQPQLLPDAEKLITAYKEEKRNRLPVKPISTLAEDFPALNPSAFVPPGPEDASVYGLVIDGNHYRSQCPTRYGPYPYCDVLALPSYSLAKSVFAGLGYLLIVQQWPEFADMPVTGLIPECALKGDPWQGVTPHHLLNMTTGLYQSSEFQKDEDSSGMQTFFLAEAHAEKVRFSCENWPKNSAAGTTAVYHSTDHYLLGVAMNNFLKQKLGPQSDIFNDLVIARFLKDLKLSPLTAWTQRTYDTHEQPFTAFGLIFYADDIARIASTLNSASTQNSNLEKSGLNAALFKGLKQDVSWNSQFGEVAYRNGFWGFELSEAIDCESQIWIPFMSGYGGIVVAMLPNGGVYYYFSDSNQHTFSNAAIEANKALNYCEE